jgi:hypothetical protein
MPMDSTNPFGDALAPEGNPFGDAPAPTPASSPAVMAQTMAAGDQPSINDVQGSASTTATALAPPTASSPTQNQPAQPGPPQTTADKAHQQALTPPNPNENAIPPTLTPNPPPPKVPPAAPSTTDQTFGIMANQFSPQEVSREIGAPDFSAVQGSVTPPPSPEPAIHNLHDLSQYGYEQEAKLRHYVGEHIKEGYNAVNDFGNSLDNPKVLKAIPSAINQSVVAGINNAGIGVAQNVEELAKTEQNQLNPNASTDPISAMVNGPIGYLATQYVSDAAQHIAKWLERDTEDFKEKQSEETRAILSSNRNVAGAVATVGTMGTQLLTTAAAGRLLGNPVEFFAGRQLALAAELPGPKGAIARQMLIRARATMRSNVDNMAQIATVAGLNAFEVQQRYAEKTPDEIAALSPEYKARLDAAKTEEEKKQIVEFAAQRAADKTYLSSLVIGIAAGRIHSEAHPVTAGVAGGAAFGAGTVVSTNYGLREVDKNQPLSEGAISAGLFWGAVSGLAAKAHETDFGGIDEKTVASVAKTRAIQLKTRAGMEGVTPEQREDMLKRAELIQRHLSENNIEKAAFAAQLTPNDIAERGHSTSGAKPVEEAVKDAVKNYINSANSNNQQKRIQMVRAIRLWATKGGKRTPSEVLSALHETIADDKLPDYIEEGLPHEQDQVSEGAIPGGAQAEAGGGEGVSPVEGGHGAAEEPEAGPHGQESGEAGEVTPRAAAVAGQLREAGIEAPVSSDGRVTVAPNNPNAQVATTLAAHDAAESPKNAYTPPTDGQKVNGNYRKGKTLFPSPQGDVRVNIENPAGSVRKSVEGEPPWERKVTEHYGYIPGTHGADGDPLDVVVGRHAHDDTLPVFVVHQTDPATGKFDELKVVMGAKTEGQARQMYLNQYPRQMHGQLIAGTPKIVRMSRGQFTDWLKAGDHATPISPISKQPMMKLQDRGELTSHFDDTVDFDALDAKVDDLNSRLGVQLTVNRSGTGYDVAGDIPKAVLPSIHKALKGVSGHEQTQFNHVDAGKVFAGRSRQRGTGVPAPAGQLDAGKRTGGQQHPVPESGDRQEGEAGPAEAPAPRWLNKPKSDAPIFQRKQGKHPSSVVAVHYSAKHGLTELDPSMSGSATPERGRLLKAAGAKAGVLDQRVHFYVRESDALPQKERIVGGEHPAAYEVRLNNLYDVAADPDGIIERAELAGKGNDHDAIVKAILKAGYDGTVHRGVANDTPVATVFGKGKIPVKHVRPQPKFMFLGRHAKTADIEKLEKAKAMHAEGKEREAHAETGWHKGKDGRYRFEISDKDIRVSDDFDELDDGESMPLEKAMPHPELFKAYPELGKVKIIKDESMGGDEAFTDPTKNEIHLGSAWKYNEGSIDQVLKHEVQHLVQLHEGFARGGSPGEFMVQVRQQLTELAKKHDEAIARMEEAEEKGDKEAFEAAKKEAEEIDQLGSSIFRENNIQSHAKYQRLAGEVEARNTSKRSEMTDAERRATHPMDMETTYKGEAIPREEQIVKYANESDMNIADSKRAGVAQETHLAAEVAPNPDNAELTREWEAMSMADRAAVTRRVGSEVVSRVAKILGVDKGKIINAVGGYEGHINPNLLTRYRRGTLSIEQARAFASGLGKALDQKSVVLVDPRASGDAGVIRVTLPRDVTPEDARVVMDAISDTGMDGFTAKGRNLDILHFGDAKDDDAMGMRVHAALDKIDSLDGFTVTTGRSKSELIGSDDYDGHLSGLRSQAGGEVHAGLRGVRDWAQAEVGREIEARTGAGKPAERSAEEVATHHDELVAHAAKITSGWKGAPDVQAVKADGEGLPDGLRAHMDQAVPEQHVPAMYYGGKVYVFPHNIVDKADLELALVHEVNGHFGLRHTFGDDLPNLLSDIHDSIKDLPAYRELAARYRKAYAGLTRQQFDHAITEEYLSNRAELQTNPGVIAKLVAFVRQWGRQHGMVRQWSDNDVTALMHRVAQNVRQGRTSRFGYPAPTTTFSGERGAATSTYEGAAGTGSIDSLYDGGRVLRVDGLTARLDRLLTEHGTGLDISDLDYAEPKRLEAVPRFAGEEGKGFVVWPEGMDAKALDDAGVPHEELVGRLVSPAVASTDATPRLSMRRPGSLSKDKDLQDRITRTIEASESEMTPWDRMQMLGRQLFAKENREQAKANIMQSNVDRFYAIGKLERKSNDGYLFDASESAFKMAHMSQHIQQVMGAVMRDGIPVYKDGAFQAVPGRKGWFDLLSPLYQHHDPGMARAFNFYLGTLRAERLLGEVNADGSPRERNFTAEDVAKGKELEAKYPWFKDVANDVQQFNHDLLDLAVERGNMTKETADMWKDNFYVPFYRAMEEKGETSATGRAFGGLKVTSKYLSGGGKIASPLESMINNTTAILDKIYKNEAVRRSIAEAVNAGIARPIGMAADPKQFSVKQIEDRLEKAGLFVGQQANAKRGAKLTLTDDQRAQYVKLLDIHPPMGENVVFAMYNGKARYYEVDDPIVRRAIGNITHEKALNRWAKVILHTPSRILRTLTVENPSFWVRHLERQWLDAKLQSGYDVHLLRKAASSALDVYTNGPMLRQLSMAGAGGNEYYNVNFAHEEMRALGKHATVLDNLHKMRMAYEKMGFVADQMNRVSLARNVLERGGSVAEAAWQAQDLLNFGMHGDNVATRYLMQAVPFLNARLQGAYRIVRGATGRDVTKQVATQIGGSLAKRFLYKGLLLTAASLALEAHNQGDPRYEKLTDEQKDLYYNFFIGDMHYAIPKPFELGAIFSTLPERLGRLVSGRDNAREFWESVARVTEATMRLDPTDIALVTPIWEDEVNKDKLTQRPILSDRYADVEPSEQYNAFTSPVVKAVAQHMPGFAPDVLRSPIRLQHLLRGYFSTVGNYAISSADVMARMFGSDNAAPSSDSPLGAAGGKMFGSMVSRSSADRRNHAEDVFWDDYHKMMVVARTVKQMKDNNDIERLNRYAASNAGYLAYKSSLTALHDKLMLMHKAELHIYTDSEMTADEKRDALLDIIKAKDELLRQNEELIQGANNL